MKRPLFSRTRFLWSALRKSALVMALFGLWAAVSGFQWVSPIFLPTPWLTASVLIEGMTDGPLRRLFFGTVAHMLYGWALASLLGIAVGAVIGNSRQARRWLQPSLEFIRPLPASAIIPVAIAIFGLTKTMLLFVVVFGSVWPVILSTARGFQSVEPRLREVSSMLGLSSWAYVWKIGLPSALPDVLAGVRLSLSIALVLVVTGEMMASQPGLGTAILAAARAYRAPELYAGVILLSLIGFLSGAALLWCERRWQR